MGRSPDSWAEIDSLTEGRLRKIDMISPAAASRSASTLITDPVLRRVKRWTWTIP
jgi:hypothetical protein